MSCGKDFDYGRARYEEAQRQMREKSGPIYERWLARWTASLPHQERIRKEKQNARSEAEPSESRRGSEKDA